jgi:hypothetical protein
MLVLELAVILSASINPLFSLQCSCNNPQLSYSLSNVAKSLLLFNVIIFSSPNSD